MLVRSGRVRGLRIEAAELKEGFMLSNRLAFAALAVACIAAAAGGGYLASRQNAVPTPAAAQTQPAPTSASAPAAVPARPVQQTEAVVGDRTPISATAATPSTTKRAERPRETSKSARASMRSEERRVGKEGRSRWSTYH